MNSTLVSQFGNPHGLLGRIAGAIMAVRPSNRERNLWVVSLLDIQPEDLVLEIGFGPGIAVAAAAAKIAAGLVVGIDHSPLMVANATARNRDAIASRKVQLIESTVDAVSSLHGRFDKVFAVNSFGFWPEREKKLHRIREAMSPGGLLAIATQPRARGATDGTAVFAGECIGKMLSTAGFDKVRVEIRKMKPVATVCVLARKPA